MLLSVAKGISFSGEARVALRIFEENKCRDTAISFQWFECGLLKMLLFKI